MESSSALKYFTVFGSWVTTYEYVNEKVITVSQRWTSKLFYSTQSQICKCLALFRNHKSANFIGMSVRKLQIRKFLLLIRKLQIRKFLQNIAQLCLKKVLKVAFFLDFYYVQILRELCSICMEKKFVFGNLRKIQVRKSQKIGSANRKSTTGRN